ncbi:hypothetical protein CASFOL_013500 [Castilleja foliolosa]|uniref:Bifunctional inhibitor/plant lipid transfer protein/seed storage helical domain-containing protein n=1 Tax=Castilleja foliolosa TaxID=1961234 RepID=A0ABD3DP80_9LAMI
MAIIKLTLAAALLVALVAVATATATSYTTTVTPTTFEDEANPGQQQQQCQRQLQGRQFGSCQRYLSQRRSAYPEEEEVIERQQLQQCCDQLRNVNDQCRCEAIKRALRQLQQQEGQQQTGQQSQQIYSMATNLPNRCNMRPRQCRIRVVFV